MTKTTRPWTLWGLSLTIALIGVMNLALAWDHARHAHQYRDLGVSYPPELRAACALLWGGSLLALSVGLARRARWAQRWILVVMSNYGTFGVLWLLAFAQSDYSRGRIIFQTALTALLLLALAWIMRWRRVRLQFNN